MTEHSDPPQGPPPPSSPPPTPSSPPPASTTQPPPPTGPPLSQPAGGYSPSRPAGGLVPEGSWGPGRTFGGLGFLIALVIVLALIVSAFDPEIETLGAQVTLQALLAGSLILTAFLFAGGNLRSLADARVLGLRRPLRPAFWLSVATYVGYVVCAIVVSLLLSPEQEDITRDLGGDSGTIGTVIAGILIVAVAPLSEEIFFRGFLFAGFRRGMPAVLAAILASAIWGLFHYTGPGTWGVVVQITIFGLWLSWLYERTGSIYATIAVHMLNNAIAFTLLLST